MEFRRPEPPFLDCAGFEIFNHDVGIGQQLAGECLPFGNAQIRGHRTLVAADDIPPDLVLTIAPLPHRIPHLRGFDLDDVGTHIAQQLTAEGSGNQLTHFDDFQILQCTCIVRNHCPPPAGNPPALASLEGSSLPITPPSQRDADSSASRSTPVLMPDRPSR